MFLPDLPSFISADGLSTIVRKEGTLGLFRGTSLALFGVSNGAIQFVVYEKMKAWGFERKRKQCERAGKEYNRETDKLVCVPCVVETGPELTRLPTHCQLLSFTTTTNPFQQTNLHHPTILLPTDRTPNSHLHRCPRIFLQSNLSYTIMSISSKLAALSVTYPYQVVRSRIQVRPRAHNSLWPVFMCLSTDR